ncbi:hypothetical protein TNCV_2044491 [Trichonephila clavipes]|nr:hypothetical protein TNCV_2044491 [Trichonephila clavipes]
MKSLVFETPVNSAEELVARISAAAGEIRNTPEMLSNVRRSMKRRCEACITCGGRAAETSRNITARDISGEIHYLLEDSRGFRTRQHGRQ